MKGTGVEFELNIICDELIQKRYWLQYEQSLPILLKN